MNSFKARREKSGLKQNYVSDKLDIAQSTISMWETGKSKPRLNILIKLAELYNCSVDELLKEDIFSTL